MSWWKSRQTKAEREIEAQKKFEENKTDLEIANSLKMSLKEVSDYRSIWAKSKNERQVKLYEMFGQGKDFVTISKSLGMTADDVANEYRAFLNLKDMQLGILREHEKEKDNAGRSKKSAPPYRVTKVVMNQLTGRKNSIEAYPVDFEEIPNSYLDFKDFAQEYGDGTYNVVDVENRKVKSIPVSGMGFDDPSTNPNNPLYDPDAAAGGMGGGYGAFGPGRSRGRFGDDFDDPYGRGGRGGRFGGRRRRGYGVDGEAEDMLEMDERKKMVFLRAAELATRQGKASEAARLLKMMDPQDIPAEKRGFLDELVETGSNNDKLKILKKIFGGEKKDEREESEQERTMKFATDHLIPSIKENLIEPVAEALGGNMSADDQLKREVMHSQLGPGSGFETGQSGTGWTKRGSIGARREPPQLPQRRSVYPQQPQQPARPSIPVDVTASEGVDEEEDDYGLGEDLESKPADDYGQAIDEHELRIANPPVPPVSDGKIKKLSLEQAWMLRNKIPKMRAMIEGYIAAQNVGNPVAIEACSPQKSARDDYYMMTKSVYARFIGKKRLLDAFHAAKIGTSGLMGDITPHIYQQINMYEETAKLVRKMGVERFKEVWEPPQGISKPKALRTLGRYMTLKSCWDTFQTPMGKDWLNKYCDEFVKSVEEEVVKSMSKKDKIQEAITPKPELPPMSPLTQAPKPLPPPGVLPPPTIAQPPAPAPVPTPEIKPESKAVVVSLIKATPIEPLPNTKEIKDDLDKILSELEPEGSK